MTRLMDIEELASYLKLDKQTIYNWLHQKRISGIKVGRVWRFDRRAIDKWLESRIVKARPGNNKHPKRKKGINA
ncbi:MAG: helix-turn-helix domain-containing protein [Candidatus Omnitrophota bacterium]